MIIHSLRLPLPNTKAVKTVDIHPECRQCVVGQYYDPAGAADLTIWDIESQTLIKELETPPESSILSTRFSPGGASVIALDATSTIRVYHLEHEQTEILKIPDGNLDWLSFSPGVNRFVAAGALTYVWDLPTASLAWTSPEEAVAVIHEGVSALGCLLNGGSQVAVAGMTPHDIVIYDLLTGQVIETLPEGPAKAARWMASDPNGKYLAVVNYEDQALLLWDLQAKTRHLADVDISGFLH